MPTRGVGRFSLVAACVYLLSTCREGWREALHRCRVPQVDTIMKLPLQPGFEALFERLGGPALLLRHLAEGTDISATGYLRSLRQQLAKSMASLVKVYLDTNYWIRLCRAATGSPDATANDVRLLKALRHLRVAGKVLCVSQFAAFQELFRRDVPGQKKIAALLDELTGGVVIAPSHELRAWESFTYVLTRMGGPSLAYGVEFTKVGFMAGVNLAPDALKHLPELRRNASAKAVFDVVWNASTYDVLEQRGWDAVVVAPRDLWNRIHDNMVQLREARAKARMDINRARRAEFEGVMQAVYAPYFSIHCRSVCESVGIEIKDQDISYHASRLVDSATEDFMKNSLGTLLPTAVIGVELYAAYERDGGRPYVENDLFDWEHASCAVPYCDYFLTEGHLANSLSTKIKVENVYGCTVIAKMAQAADHFEKLADAS